MWQLDDLTKKVLVVDLDSGQITTSIEVPDLYRLFLGGRGLDQLFLYNMIDPATTPMDPQNALLFGAGLLSGTPVPSATRISIDAKNAFSGGVGSANAADGFSSALKQAGFGALIIRGKADKPACIDICDGDVQIRPADHLWGKTVTETVRAVASDVGKTASVAAIGPAGENLVRGACIMVNATRAAAKCGLGAVMGSKQLKAVIVRGSGTVQVAQKEKFAAICRRLRKKLTRSASAQRMDTYGTKAAIKGKNAVGAVAFRHFQDGRIDSLDGLDEQAFARYEQKRRFGCKGCPITCRQRFRIEDGPYAGSEGEAVHCNTIQDFGTKLDIRYTPAIIKANLLCNDYGMDIDTVGECVAWAFECYEKGLITENDTGGLALTWGNHAALIDLIHQIATRSGFGDILAEGVLGAAERVGRGTEEHAIAMKGQDLYEDPRIPKGYGLGVALATRGGGHCSGSPQVEFFGAADGVGAGGTYFGLKHAGNPTSYSQKGELVAYHERLHAVINSLGLCFFSSVWVGEDLLDENDYADLVAAATGWEMDAAGLMLIGERIHNLERLFNARHAGFDRQDDYPHPKFFKEAIKSGAYQGERLDRALFDTMLDENYAAHGWDRRGLPKMETLRSLELDRWLHRLPDGLR